MTNEMRFKILIVATEAVPFAKEGGVADVIGSLPIELAALGHEVRIFLPRYGIIDAQRWALKPTGVVRTFSIGGVDRTVSILQTTLPDAPVTVYLLEHDEFFGRHQRLYLGMDQRDEQR
ncbi:MAG TPA: glycogen/starch synthase, partial [Ktedonobacteraceae bacterium]